MTDYGRLRAELESACEACAGGAGNGPLLEDVERLLAASLHLLAARAEAGEGLPGGRALTPTGALTLSSRLLESVNLEVFELALWESWGRAGELADQ